MHVYIFLESKGTGAVSDEIIGKHVNLVNVNFTRRLL